MKWPPLGGFYLKAYYMVFAGTEIGNLTVNTQPMYEPKIEDVGIVLIFFSVGSECHCHQERYRISTGKILYKDRNKSPSALISSWRGGLFNNDCFITELNNHVEDNFL